MQPILVDLASLPQSQRAATIERVRAWWPELGYYIAGSQLDPNEAARDGRILGRMFVWIDPELLAGVDSKKLKLRLVRKTS
jgi:hypothetical protein